MNTKRFMITCTSCGKQWDVIDVPDYIRSYHDSTHRRFHADNSEEYLKGFESWCEGKLKIEKWRK